MRKSKYLHEAGVLKDRSPLVPIGFARGTAEFGAPEFGKRAGTEIVKLI